MANETAADGRTIHSESRGGHWVAWVGDASGKPLNSVVLIGETREEAEGRAKTFYSSSSSPSVSNSDGSPSRRI
jgi:hypothetical protein